MGDLTLLGDCTGRKKGGKSYRWGGLEKKWKDPREQPLVPPRRMAQLLILSLKSVVLLALEGGGIGALKFTVFLQH